MNADELTYGFPDRAHLQWAGPDSGRLVGHSSATFCESSTLRQTSNLKK